MELDPIPIHGSLTLSLVEDCIKRKTFQNDKYKPILYTSKAEMRLGYEISCSLKITHRVDTELESTSWYVVGEYFGFFSVGP